MRERGRERGKVKGSKINAARTNYLVPWIQTDLR